MAVYLSAPDGADVEEQFSKVAGALSLLEKADPIRFQRFKAAFASILVFETDNSNAVVERDSDTGLFGGYVPGFPGAHSQGAS